MEHPRRQPSAPLRPDTGGALRLGPRAAGVAGRPHRGPRPHRHRRRHDHRPAPCRGAHRGTGSRGASTRHRGGWGWGDSSRPPPTVETTMNAHPIEASPRCRVRFVVALVFLPLRSLWVGAGARRPMPRSCAPRHRTSPGSSACSPGPRRRPRMVGGLSSRLWTPATRQHPIPLFPKST